MEVFVADPDVLLPDIDVIEPVCDPELFADPVLFSEPELLLSSLLLSSVEVALALAVVREPLEFSPVAVPVLSSTLDESPDETLLEESTWRATSKGAISRLRASTGLFSMDGHADVVAASSRTVERTAEGRMAASSLCAWTVETAEFPREGLVGSYSEVECSKRPWDAWRRSNPKPPCCAGIMLARVGRVKHRDRMKRA